MRTKSYKISQQSKEITMEYTHYKELDLAGDELWYQKKFGQYLELMDYALERFPEQYIYATFNKVVAYIELQDYPACLDTIKQMQERGLGCPLYWNKLDPLRTLPGYPKIEEENNRLIAQAQAMAKMKYDVHLPAGYTPQRHYPLFIVLHGDGLGGNNEFQSWYWEPGFMLKHGMITVYAQSSQVHFPGHYAWLDDYSIAKKELRDCFNQVSAQYSIDPDNIYMGGFSGGAIMSTEIVMANDLPVKGWVALCPEIKPPAFTKFNLTEAKKRGVKAVFLEGELKALLPDEQEMVDMFQETGFPYELYINKGIGHSFPKDLGEKIDRAIAFITGK
jgi:predicted esterase